MHYVLWTKYKLSQLLAPENENQASIQYQNHIRILQILNSKHSVSEILIFYLLINW